MARIQQNLLLLTANLLIPLGVIIYFTGFFRGRLRTIATDEVDSNEIHEPSLNPALFDKVIFMMIDALRSDFVYAENSGFTFTQSLIRSGAAVPFTALAASPTLTLSRIKALTQGTSQSFLDALLNVLHSEGARRLQGEDTWLSRLKKERNVEKRMVFYGVDMWTMLYPDIWDRHEIIDSFYLPDFISVDHNITRHLFNELAEDDWKALVLHYVGLDNLAHFGGARNSHMLPKQIEMDSIVRQIYEAIEEKSHMSNSLLVLLGDHGMNEKGNHGGDSPGEIASALTFISPRFKSISTPLESPVAATKDHKYYSAVDQIDIVPTLASLLGISTPMNSAGRLIPQFLGLWQSPEAELRIRLKNAEQLMAAFEMRYNMSATTIVSCGGYCEGCPSHESRVICFWEAVKRAEEDRKASQNTSSEDLVQAINNFSDCAQQCLSVPLNNLSLLHLSAGIACMAALMLLLAIAYASLRAPWDSGGIIFASFIAFHAMMMFKGRLVEEEHLFWYWSSLGWLGYLGLKRAAAGEHWLKSAYPIVLQFLSQCLNPSGDVPYSTVEYIHDFLFHYPVFLWILVFMAWVLAVKNISKQLAMSLPASLVTSSALGFLAVSFKICSTQAFNPELVSFIPSWLQDLMLGSDRNFSLRIFWTGLVACLVYLIAQSIISESVSRMVIMTGVIELASFYIRSQTRPKSLVLYTIFDLQLKWLLSPGAELNPSNIAVTVLLLSQSSFYVGGRNNSFASFDMMNGYNGIDHTNNDFNVLAVTIQTIISNWLGPIWWSLASLRMLLASLEIQDGSRVRLDRSQTTSPNPTWNGIKDKSGNVSSSSETRIKSIDDVKPDGFSLSSTSDDPKTQYPKAGRRVQQQQQQQQRQRRPFFEYLTLHTIFTASSTLAVMLACIWLRNDPALWTILAPKYVNVALWAVFHHLAINVVLCTGIWSAIVR